MAGVTDEDHTEPAAAGDEQASAVADVDPEVLERALVEARARAEAGLEDLSDDEVERLLKAQADDERWAVEHDSVPRSTVERMRQRSSVGAVGTALGMAFQEVFQARHKKEAAIVIEAAGDLYDESDPVVVDYVPDDAPATTVSIRPWLLGKEKGRS